METFEKAFGRKRISADKQKTFADISGILNSASFDYFQMATKDYLNGNLHNALSNINKSIDNSEICNWEKCAFRANIYEDLKDFRKAILNYEQAIEYAFDDVLVYALYHQIGYCYVMLNDNPKALEFYTYAIDLKKQHPNTEICPDQEGLNGGVLLGVPLKKMYNNRGNANLNLGRLYETGIDCKAAIDCDKDYSNPYLLMAQVFSKEGKEAEAMNCLEAAASLGNKTAISMLQRLFP